MKSLEAVVAEVEQAVKRAQASLDAANVSLTDEDALKAVADSKIAVELASRNILELSQKAWNLLSGADKT